MIKEIRSVSPVVERVTVAGDVPVEIKDENGNTVTVNKSFRRTFEVYKVNFLISDSKGYLRNVVRYVQKERLERIRRELVEGVVVRAS